MDSASEPRARRPASVEEVRWWTGLLLVAFTLHNLEELLLHDSGTGGLGPGGPMQRWSEMYQTDRFLGAVVILTVAVTALLLPATVRRTPLAARLALLATGALLGNALSHVGQGVAFRDYNPGLVTAVVLVLPAAVQLVRLLRGQAGTGRAGTVGVLAAGAVLAVPAIVLSLLISWAVVG
ncbi:HXXEE domain-containing protein [Sanguibacter sp. 25GB23B1]|uniref:HXXEE domain-containing protein n=1 Tax=unclassified Sanguibacter TaxID=2645534 RepID=UPI0032AF0DCE